MATDRELKAAIGKAERPSLSESFSALAGWSASPSDYDLIVPLATKGDDVIAYALEDGESKGKIVEFDDYRLKGQDNVFYASGLKSMTGAEFITQVGLDAMNAAINANYAAGENGGYFEEGGEANKAWAKYEENGVKASDLDDIRSTIQSYRSNFEVAAYGKDSDEITKVRTQIGNALRGLDAAQNAPEAIADFSEVVKGAINDELTYDQAQLVLTRFDTGQDTPAQDNTLEIKK